MIKQVWVLAEQTQGELEEISQELLCWGRKVTDKLNGGLCAVIFGEETNGLVDSLAYYGAEKVYVINDSALNSYTLEAYTEALAFLINQESPDIVLCSGTVFGEDIASSLSARLETGLAPNCIGLDVAHDGLLLAVIPVYGGRLEATVVCPTGRPQVATVKPGMIDIKPSKANRKAEVITINPQTGPVVTRSRVIGFMKADPRTVSLDQAEIIVAGGGGVGSCEGFRLLEELAELLGGCVAASRIPVDRGWFPDDKRIGQTGAIVSPRLYVAVGISGSIYHTMGMKDSKVIIAINKDRNAPIFKLADMGIVADWQETVSAMIGYLRETGGNAT